MNATICVVYDKLPTVEVLEHEEDEHGNVFTLLHPISYDGVIIPSGFRSDGASVPRVFWGVVFPRGDRQALFGALFHDYLYRHHPADWTREEADNEFYFLLREGGVSYIRALRAYIGVRLFGKSSWEAKGK